MMVHQSEERRTVGVSEMVRDAAKSGLVFIKFLSLSNVEHKTEGPSRECTVVLWW